MSTSRIFGITSPAVVAVYAAGLLQGLTLVSFPALSSVLKQSLGFTDAEYGAIFLPQLAMALVSAITGGAAARRVGLKRLLVLALAANAVSQLLLAASGWMPSATSFLWVLIGTASLGLGLGLIGAPINSYPPIFFPRQVHASVVAVHTLIGLGLALGPLLAGPFIATSWAGFPLLLAALCGMLAVITLAMALPDNRESNETANDVATDRPLRAPAFWLFVGITVLYAFAEGTFANWAVIYLSEAKRLPMAIAAFALSVFWGALVSGRLLVSALVTRIPAAAIWGTLPVLIIIAFLLLPYAMDAVTGIALFALAGFACSAFLPLTISLASQRFPRQIALVSSMLIAALMVGVGMGSFLIGSLREFVALEDLYRLSAAYPAAILLLALLLLRGKDRQTQPTVTYTAERIS